MGGKRIVLVGLAQAVGTALYVGFVVLLMRAVEGRFGPEDTYFLVLSFLLLFVVSASITGGLVLGYPAVLALRQRVRDAVLLLGATLGWLLLLLAGSLAVAALQARAPG